MIKKVCLITNYNLYESKRIFTENLAKAMNKKGIETKIIDVRESTLELASIEAIKHFNPDFTCSFNTLLPISNSQFLWDILKIPHWSIVVDPSLYSVRLINSPYSIISCVDRFDCEALLSTGFKNTFFFPHGVQKDLEIGKEERIYDVVFLGSCFDYESMRKHWQENLTHAQSDVLEKACDIVLSDNHTSLHEALVKAWNAANLFPSENIDFATLFYYLDIYTRGKDRIDLIKSIKDATVHIFGQLQDSNDIEHLGWDDYLKSQENVVLHHSVPFTEALEILKRSKICLNSNPFFKNGSHERVFNSLACGAVPLTTDNLFVREQFIPDQDLLLYQHHQLNQVNDRINTLLKDEKKRAQIANSGRQKVMQHHTWDSRVEEMKKAMEPILASIKV